MSDRRQQLIDTAIDLFYKNGIHATGIDTLLAKAGVAKMTLYKHFKTKDELVLAALRTIDERYRNNLMREVERLGNTPVERLHALFDLQEIGISAAEFRGCAFVKFATEYSCHENPVHVVAAESKRLMLDYIRSLAAEAGAADPETLALQLMLIQEGTNVYVLVTGRSPMIEARAAATQLIEQAISRRLN